LGIGSFLEVHPGEKSSAASAKRAAKTFIEPPLDIWFKCNEVIVIVYFSSLSNLELSK
jgi:hypothetical protein